MAGRPPRPSGGPAAGRRAARLAQLARLSDDDFAAEVRQHQAARWRVERLIAHAKEHASHFRKAIGQVLSPQQLDALSRDVLRSWDRLLTELEPGGVTYYFVQSLPTPDAAIIVVTRGGHIRSTFPARRLSQLWERRWTAIEVTDRAKGLGL